jgi:hypothetical protein
MEGNVPARRLNDQHSFTCTALLANVRGPCFGTSRLPDWKRLAHVPLQQARHAFNLIAKARRFRIKSLRLIREQLRASANMDIIQQLKAGILSHGSMAVIAVVGVVALVLAIKIAHFLARLLLGLIALAAIGGAVWWFFLKH